MAATHRAIRQPSTSQPRLILMLVASATALANLEVGMVNVALPSLAVSFGVSRATIQWVALAYQIALVGTLVLFGRLIDLVGARHLYCAGMATLAAASLLAALSQTALWLIGARGLLGLGAAMLLATGQALIAHAYPTERRGRALGVMHMAVAGGLMAGPSVGGVLLITIGWRALFLAPLPLAVGALWLAATSLSPLARQTSERLDLLGAVLVCTATILFIFGLTHIAQNGWTQAASLLLLFALGATLLFVLVEHWQVAPLVDLRLLTHWHLAAGLLTAFLTFIALAANMFLVPFALQTVMGYSAAISGLVMMTVPLALLPVAPLAGAFADRFGSRLPTAAGLAVIIVAILGMAQFRATTSVRFVVVVLALYGIGAGLFQAPNNRTVLESAPRGQIGVVSGMLALSRNLGQVVGVVVASSVWAGRQAYYERRAVPLDQALATGLRDAFVVLAACGILALSISAGRSTAETDAA